jgi:uncharacterized protein
MPEVDGAVPPPSEQTIQALKRRGYLTEKSPEEEENFLAEAAAKLHERSCQKMPEYIFMPTYDCNLRCSYCFQDHMRTDSKFRHLLRVIEPATVDRIFVAMGEIESLHGSSQEKTAGRRIGFFGGEPLLAACRPIVEYIIQKALALGPAKLWAVTNGTDLHVYKDLLSKEGLSALQITIDGPSGEHDRRRIYADGSGSYARIADNIDLALERGVQVNVRLNVDRSNIAQLPTLAREFIARGWHQHPGFSAYTAPVRAENEHTAAETTFDTWELDQALVALTAEEPAIRPSGGRMIRSSSRPESS